MLGGFRPLQMTMYCSQTLHSTVRCNPLDRASTDVTDGKNAGAAGRKSRDPLPFGHTSAYKAVMVELKKIDADGFSGWTDVRNRCSMMCCFFEDKGWQRDGYEISCPINGFDFRNGMSYLGRSRRAAPDSQTCSLLVSFHERQDVHDGTLSTDARRPAQPSCLLRPR